MSTVTTQLTGTQRGLMMQAGVSGTGIIWFGTIPFTGVINSMTLLADASGSIVIDIWKVPYGSYPPTITNSICASALPTLSSAQNTQDNTLTGWTTQVNAGDVIFLNVNSVTTVAAISMTLGMLGS